MSTKKKLRRHGKVRKKTIKVKAATSQKSRSKSKKTRSYVDKGSDYKQTIHDGQDSFDLMINQKIMNQSSSSRVYSNKYKQFIAKDMLERYTGHSIEDFQSQIILTNFHYYLERFNHLLDDSFSTRGSAFKASSSPSAKVTIIEFGIGSAMAALIMELVSVVNPKAVLFLGMCGAVHQSLKVGDFILPMAAIRAEGVSTHFMPKQVPALPTFKIQKFVSQILVEDSHDYRTGTIHSTDLRFWEFDQDFKKSVLEERVLAVEMECAALFITGFASKVNIGALLLVSDCPLKRKGIKTKKSSKEVFNQFTDIHIEIGIKSMKDIAKRGEKIRHYRW